MDASYTRQYARFERRHWWYRARREIIQQFLDRYAPGNEGPDPRWLDVGCGTGVLLESYPRIQRKMGLELDGESARRGRSSGLEIVQIGPQWDFRRFGRFDIVTLCDVIEHVEHEREALDAVWDVLNPGGVVLVTVPAIKSLWSSHDVINHHFRRYQRGELRRLFEHPRWQVLRISYFSSLLFPLIWTVRQLKNARERLSPSAPTHDFAFGPPLVDALLYRIFRMEKRWLGLADLPIGSSLILVARKTGARVIPAIEKQRAA